MKRNPDDHGNYELLLKANKVDPAKTGYTEAEATLIAKLLDGTRVAMVTCVEQAKKHPKCGVPMRLMLKYFQGEAFTKKFDEYIQHATARAVPSLFVSIKQLYVEPKKVQAIEDLLSKHLVSLRSNGTFAGSETEQDPMVFLWLLLFAAQHYDTKKDYKQALILIDEAIEHTPTLVEAYTAKARILKHMEDFAKAADTYDLARKLDQADRYLNARCSKYLIRAGKVEEAEKMMALFAREINSELNVHEMQCMWYELELGAAYAKKKQLAKSYKMYKYVQQHFDTIYDDQVTSPAHAASLTTTTTLFVRAT